MPNRSQYCYSQTFCATEARKCASKLQVCKYQKTTSETFRTARILTGLGVYLLHVAGHENHAPGSFGPPFGHVLICNYINDLNMLPCQQAHRVRDTLFGTQFFGTTYCSNVTTCCPIQSSLLIPVATQRQQQVGRVLRERPAECPSIVSTMVTCKHNLAPDLMQNS